MSTKRNRRQQSLRVQVKDGALTISIGVETLAWAFERLSKNQPLNERHGDEDNDDSPEFVQRLLITNPGGFAVEVMHAMEAEEEDGNTELAKFLDSMCEAAVEDGSEFVDFPEGMEMDDREFDDRVREWRKAKKGAKRA